MSDKRNRPIGALCALAIAAAIVFVPARVKPDASSQSDTARSTQPPQRQSPSKKQTQNQNKAPGPGQPKQPEKQKKQKEPPPPPTPRPDQHVVIISIDGMIPDYYTRPAELGLTVPTLTSMKLGGAYADGVSGVYPTLTYPSHTTIVTGVRPGVHGIVENRVFHPPTEPQTGEWYWFSSAIKSETLWQAAKKGGLSTGAVGWPVTAGADIDYNVPEIWNPAEHPPTPLRALQNSTPGLIQKVLATAKPATGDNMRTTIAEFVIKTYRPNLMLVHLVELDESQHEYGPRTPQAIETMQREDGYIGRILKAVRDAGIFDKTTIFVVSDHGFAEVNKYFEPNVRLVKEKLITLGAGEKPVSWKAVAVPSGGSCAIRLNDPKDTETADKVIEVFSKIALKNPSPLSQVVGRKELDRLEAVPKALVMLDASPGYEFDGEFTGAEIRDSGKSHRGTHGYLPGRVEMHSSLLVYGDAARVGASIPLALMIDIAPTAAGL
ncbi:MAG TPA: ectonucleotide pyrophosphatase/phosphodiesterase, partial [Blastocatellia bacterium]|nr:ectonucleotide pyrophosphatase/phosphodiesterase [Blastocatellia bacterium]